MKFSFLALAAGAALGIGLFSGSGPAYASAYPQFNVSECSLTGTNADTTTLSTLCALNTASGNTLWPQPVVADALDGQYATIVTLNGASSGTFSETGHLAFSAYWNGPTSATQGAVTSQLGAGSYELVANITSSSGGWTSTGGTCVSTYCLSFNTMNINLYAVQAGTTLTVTGNDTYAVGGAAGDINTGAGGNAVLIGTATQASGGASIDYPGVPAGCTPLTCAYGNWSNLDFPLTLTGAGGNYYSSPSPFYLNLYNNGSNALPSVSSCGTNCTTISDNGSDEVAFVPEPASLILFGSALFGLGGIARRRRNGRTA